MGIIDHFFGGEEDEEQGLNRPDLETAEEQFNENQKAADGYGTVGEKEEETKISRRAALAGGAALLGGAAVTANEFLNGEETSNSNGPDSSGDASSGPNHTTVGGDDRDENTPIEDNDNENTPDGDPEPEGYQMADDWMDIQTIREEDYWQEMGVVQSLDFAIDDIREEVGSKEEYDTIQEYAEQAAYHAAKQVTAREGPAAIDYVLQQLDFEPDESLTRHTTFNAGMQGTVGFTLLEDPEGGYTAMATQPRGESMRTSESIEPGDATLRRGETPETGAETSMDDAHDDSVAEVTTATDTSNYSDFAQTYGEIDQDSIRWANRQNNNISLTSLQENIAGFTYEAGQIIGGPEDEDMGILDMDRINADPENVGQDAYNLTEKFTENVYNEAIGSEGDYIEIDHKQNDSELESHISDINVQNVDKYMEKGVMDLESEQGYLTFTRVGEERHNELVNDVYPELIEWLNN